MERAFNIYSMYENKINLGDRVNTFEALDKYAQRNLEEIATGQVTKRSAASVPLSLFNDRSSVSKML